MKPPVENLESALELGGKIIDFEGELRPDGLNKLKTLLARSLEKREELAELEHDQWIAWSKNIAKTENITPARLERWQKLWRPYSELTEAEKDQDREWADKVLQIIQNMK